MLEAAHRMRAKKANGKQSTDVNPKEVFKPNDQLGPYYDISCFEIRHLEGESWEIKVSYFLAGEEHIRSQLRPAELLKIKDLSKGEWDFEK